MNKRMALFILTGAFLITSAQARDVDPVVVEKVNAVLVDGVHVAPIEYQGENYWAKRTEKMKTRKGNCIKYYLAKLIPYRVLRPSYYCHQDEAIHKEVERIDQLEQAGVAVPHVLAAQDDWIVISDMGESLSSVLDKANDEERLNILILAAQEIGRMHQKGQWHGRAHVKDVMYKDGKIGFIDFEEDPSNELSPAECQARDILVFAYSTLHMIHDNPDGLKQILDAYKAEAPPEAWVEFIKTARDLRPWLATLTPLADVVGRDMRRAIATKIALDKILDDEK